MKRFAWPLERVLDVAQRREQLLQADLARLDDAIAAQRRQIERARRALAVQLASMAQLPMPQRAAQQELFMTCCVSEERVMAAAQGQLDQLAETRQQTMQKLLALRTRRKSLEQLRERARVRHQKEMDRLEQKQLDEVGRIAFIRGAGRPAKAASNEV